MPKYCPECLAEYEDGFSDCSDCQKPLVDEKPVPLSAPVQNTDDSVTVFETGNFGIFSVAQSLLQNANILFYTSGEDLPHLFGVGIMGARFNPLVGGSKIYVLKKDESLAREILKDLKP